MGEAQEWLFEPEFNRAVKVCTSDERITSDAGLLLLREADHRLGLTEHLARQLVDPRRQEKRKGGISDYEVISAPFCLGQRKEGHQINTRQYR